MSLLPDDRLRLVSNSGRHLPEDRRDPETGELPPEPLIVWDVDLAAPSR